MGVGIGIATDCSDDFEQRWRRSEPLKRKRKSGPWNINAAINTAS
jgi:hypothetical protein